MLEEHMRVHVEKLRALEGTFRIGPFGTFKVGQLIYVMKYVNFSRELTFEFGMIVDFESETLAKVLFESTVRLVGTEYLVSLETYKNLMQGKTI